MKTNNFFTRFSQKVAYITGHPITFVAALGVIVAWALSGPVFGFNDTWQLVINTSTTIITFLMVFLIQSTQNRDTVAIQLKLDELIRATEGAHTVLLDMEELNEDQLEHFRKQYEKIARVARVNIKHGGDDRDVPDVDISGVCETSGKDK